MILHLKQSEIDRAIQLCDEFEQKSIKQSMVNSPDTSKSDDFRRMRDQFSSPFASYLLIIGEPKLTELEALMYYGRDKSVGFDLFNDFLEDRSAIPTSERHSNIVNKSPVFSQYIKIGLQQLIAEGHSLSEV